MSCEICNRGNCTKVFHSFDEQNDHDSIADNVKNKIKSNLNNLVNKLDSIEFENDTYIKLSDVENIIEDID